MQSHAAAESASGRRAVNASADIRLDLRQVSQARADRCDVVRELQSGTDEGGGGVMHVLYMDISPQEAERIANLLLVISQKVREKPAEPRGLSHDAKFATKPTDGDEDARVVVTVRREA